MNVNSFFYVSVLIGGIASNALSSNPEEIYELDVGTHSLRYLREIPIDNFRKSNIKLYNLTPKKFFDRECYTQSICNKILKVAGSMCFTSSKDIERIEYTSNSTKAKSFQIYSFMKKIATGLRVNFKEGGTCELEDWRVKGDNIRYYNIVVIHNNEVVKPYGQIDNSIEMLFIPGLPMY